MKVLTHLCAVTMNPDRDIIEDACICIEGDRIVAVCPTAEMPEPFRTAEHVDCSGKVVVPGMINSGTQPRNPIPLSTYWGRTWAMS